MELEKICLLDFKRVEVTKTGKKGRHCRFLDAFAFILFTFASDELNNTWNVIHTMPDCVCVNQEVPREVGEHRMGLMKEPFPHRITINHLRITPITRYRYCPFDLYWPLTLLTLRIHITNIQFVQYFAD